MQGLPLLPGENVLWEARPEWRKIARSLFQIHLVLLYFSLVFSANSAMDLVRGLAPQEALKAEAPLLLTAAAVCGLILLLARAMKRSTVYALTDRRLVLRFGIALPATLSLPLRVIGSVSVRLTDGTAGDIVFALRPGERIGFFKVWPFVRITHPRNAQPVLRAVPAAGLAGTLISRTLAAAQEKALAEIKQANVLTASGNGIFPSTREYGSGHDPSPLCHSEGGSSQIA